MESGCTDNRRFPAYFNAVLFIRKTRVTDEHESLELASLSGGGDAERHRERTYLACHQGHPCGKVLGDRP